MATPVGGAPPRMIPKEVQINGRTWVLGETLGSGGYGHVYAAASADDHAAIKLVLKIPGASRELLLARDLSGAPNVLPLHGVGEASGCLAILMPRATQSLGKLLQVTAGQLSPAEIVPVLRDVALALVGLKQNGVVHRDLKPDNILLLDGRWYLSDFGIARYVEATTATHTRRTQKSNRYAAPEQWRELPTTFATDVYAFGITAYELLAGELPFNGPEVSDFRRQHLEEQPPNLPDTVDVRLRGAVGQCLIKAPEGRLSPERLLDVIESLGSGNAPGDGAAALAEANMAEVEHMSQEATLKSAARTEHARRSELFEASKELFLGLERKLCDYIRVHAPAASTGAWPIRFGAAQLDLSAPTRLATTDQLPFDVITHCEITITQPAGRDGIYRGRSHSLWYCDAQNESEYGWYETAFIGGLASGSYNASARHLPFAMDPDDAEAAEAIQEPRRLTVRRVNWPFTLLISDAQDEFVDRWAIWLAAARNQELARPNPLPEHYAVGSWRQ